MKRRAMLKALSVGLLGAGVPLVIAETAWSKRIAGPVAANLVLRHLTGPAPCCGIAFRLKRIPDFDAPVRVADFTLPDGTPVTPNTPRLCGSCGGRLGLMRRHHIEDERFPGRALLQDAHG